MLIISIIITCIVYLSIRYYYLFTLFKETQICLSTCALRSECYLYYNSVRTMYFNL